MQAMDSASPLGKLLNNASEDKVVVLIQLHGGNDGLNMLIPAYRYDDYYNIRANIAIPQSGARQFIMVDDSVPDEAKVGLHPDMGALKEMYDNGMASFVQNVGYEHMNMSHFRGRDIVFMGGGYNDRISSGWMGRFLDHEFAGYPEAYPNSEMPDPPGLEMGNAMSLAFHRSNGIPIGLSIGSPNNFYDLIKNTGIDAPTEFPANHHGAELKYLTDYELKANQYADRLKQVYDAGKNSANVEYPDKYPFNAPYHVQRNGLADQLKIVARLLKGGSKTRIFLVRRGGFDTHGDQVENYDATMGVHAALMHHVTTAVKAFFDDLEDLGLGDKVMAMTFSEFGRRAYSNGSYGTDHGKAGPIMLFGKGLKGGIYGQNPDFDDLDRGNLRPEIDYRQVYTSVLQDWLGADDQAMADSLFTDFIDSKLDLFGTTNIRSQTTGRGTQLLGDIYPNPAVISATIPYHIGTNENVILRLYTSAGRLVKTIQNGFMSAGSHQAEVNLNGLPRGAYFVRIQTSQAQSMKKLLIQ